MIYTLIILTLLNGYLVWRSWRLTREAKQAALDAKANVFWDFTEDGQGVIIRNREGKTMTIFKEPIQ